MGGGLCYYTLRLRGRKKMNEEEFNKVYTICNDFCTNLDKILIGQENVKRITVASMLCDTNSKFLLIGNTGVGKTTLAKSLANHFNSEKIAITSDLLPSDIQEQLKDKRDMQFLHIDEFNRASGKVQSAFIELFSEKQMTIGGIKYPFSDFYVFATQNSADIAGIFNVPQAMYDRFDVSIFFEELTGQEKRNLIFSDFAPTVSNFSLSLNDLQFTKDVVQRFSIDQKSEDIMMKSFQIIDNMRIERQKLFAGSNIRAHKFLLKLAKLNAIINGRNYILSSDIVDYVNYVYRHRINQNVAVMDDENVLECFEKTKDRIEDIKRQRIRR